MENPPFWRYLPGKMWIFHGYVSFREGGAETCCRTTQEKDLTLQHNRVKVSQNRCLSIVGPRFLEWSFHVVFFWHFLDGFSDDIQHPRCSMYDGLTATTLAPFKPTKCRSIDLVLKRWQYRIFSQWVWNLLSLSYPWVSMRSCEQRYPDWFIGIVWTYWL